MTESTETTAVKGGNESNKERIAQLEAQVKQLMEMLQRQVQPQPTYTVAPTADNQTIKIVHLVERAPGLKTLIQLSNGFTITMTKFGEERTLSVTHFEELIGKYRKWFDMGIIAIHADYEEKAKYYMLDTAASYPVNGDFVRELKKKTMSEIENVYPRLPSGGKDFICSYWHRMARQGDVHFADIRNLETMNRLSDGAFSQLIAELNAKRK